MQRILITGGSGPFARRVAAALVEGPDADVLLVDTAFTAEPPPGARQRAGDLREPAFAAEVVAGRDTVLHLAPLRPTPGGDSSQDAGMLRVDEATRGTYTLLTQALDAGARRFVVASTLDLFARLPAHWHVTEDWRPRPEPRPEHLAPWLAELSVREIVRTEPGARALCLRFGRIVEDADTAGAPALDPDWLHADDALAGVRCALAYLQTEHHDPDGWRVFHIAAPGPRAKIRVAEAGRDGFGYRPIHDFARWLAPQATAPQNPAFAPWRDVLAPDPAIPSRPIRRIVIFGAGGPVAASAAQELAPSCTLRLTDARPIAEIAGAGKPQSEGAPLPVVLPVPHECRVVDVRDANAVDAACEGMDAVLICSVVRPDHAGAFQVNTLGAYHIVNAAVRLGIRRVVHTGPQQIIIDNPVGYWNDYDVPGDAPARPGRHLYAHSKFLGQEICRVFAEHHGLEVPNLLYCQFVNPDEHSGGLYHFAVSWADSARALRRAVEVSGFPAPYVEMNVCADLPHGRISNERARLLLGWEPRDPMPHLWSDAPNL